MGSAVSIWPLVQARRVLRSDLESSHQPRQPYWHRSDDVGLMYIHYDEPGGDPPPPERYRGRRRLERWRLVAKCLAAWESASACTGSHDNH
jgi:hypothetical protein